MVPLVIEDFMCTPFGCGPLHSLFETFRESPPKVT